MKLLHQRVLTLFLSLAFLAASTSAATAASKASTSPMSFVPTSSYGDTAPSGDNNGELNKSGSNGSNTSESSSKIWWDISSSGHADESPLNYLTGGTDGIFLNLSAESAFQLKAKFAGSTKTLIDVSSEASRIRTDGLRQVKSVATVLGTTVYNKNRYNYDGDSESLTAPFDKSKTFFSKTVPVWWFLKVKVSMGGEVGLDPNMRADADEAQADMEPFGGVNGTGSVILDLGVLKGGVTGKLTLAEISTPIDAEMRIDDTDDYNTRICYTVKAKNTLEALSGSISVWGKYWLPFVGWSKKYSKNVYSWNGFEMNLNTLYNKNSCQWI
jgi:hypothetical protein